MDIPQTHIDELVTSLTAHLAPEDIMSELEQLRAVIPNNTNYACALSYAAYFAGIHAGYQQQLAALMSAKRKDRTLIRDCKATLKTIPSGPSVLRELNNAYRQVDDAEQFSRELWHRPFNPSTIRMYATSQSVSIGNARGKYGIGNTRVARNKRPRPLFSGI
ncbi:MAG: hypothetical protein AABY01_00825 [Nanoarchaeota archaeon]